MAPSPRHERCLACSYALIMVSCRRMLMVDSALSFEFHYCKNVLQVADLIDDVPQLQRIVNAYAPKKIREGQQIVWALDARMAEIIRSTSEPMIGQMRLTWWHEALTKDPKAGGSGEQLMAALRRQVLPLSGGESLR